MKVDTAEYCTMKWYALFFIFILYMLNEQSSVFCKEERAPFSYAVFQANLQKHWLSNCTVK